MGSPQPQFHNVWEIYLRIRDALRAVPQDGALQQVLSSISTTREPQDCLDEIPVDLQEEDELLVVDESDDEGSGPVVDLTEDEDHGEDDGHSIGLDFL